MEIIKSYLSIIDARLLKHITGRPGQFIELFCSREWLSEEAFIQQLNGKKYSRSNYWELKSRTVKILQLMALVSTPRGNSVVKNKYDFCQKKFVIAQKFLNTGQRKEGLRLAKQAYEIAVAYDFTQLACELASIIYHDYIYYHPHPQKAEHFAQQSERFLHNYLVEKKVEHRYFKVFGQLKGALDAEDLARTIQELAQWNGQSIKAQSYQAMLVVLYGFRIGDYPRIREKCREVLAFFEYKKGVFSSHRQFFLINQGIAEMVLQDYPAAKACFDQAQSHAPPKSVNDYISRYYQTLNALHAGDYPYAYECYRKNRRCKYEMVREQFAIIEAYLCFCAHLGYLQLDRIFRLGKYLNETFRAQRDKQGDNVAILIAELLVHLARDRGKFIDRVDAISKYSYRHLKTPETQRAKHFIKILASLPSANFNPTALERKAAPAIAYLHDNPLRLGENFAIEIIPFDRLLEMIIKKLEKRVA